MQRLDADMMLLQGTKSTGQIHAATEIQGFEGKYWILESGTTKGGCNGVAIIFNKWAYECFEKAGSRGWVFGDDKPESGQTWTNEGRWLGVELKVTDAKGKTVDMFVVSTYAPTSDKPVSQLWEWRRGFHWMKYMAKDKLLICGGDLNAALGISTSTSNKVVGPYGVKQSAKDSKRNQAGNKIKHALTKEKMIVMSTHSEHMAKDTGGGTWTKQGDTPVYCQNDHFITQAINFDKFWYARTMAEKNSPTTGDHRAVDAQIRIARKLNNSAQKKHVKHMKPDMAARNTEEGQAAMQRAFKDAIDKIQEKGGNHLSLDSMTEICKAGIDALPRRKSDAESWTQYQQELIQKHQKDLDELLHQKSKQRNINRKQISQKNRELFMNSLCERIENAKRKVEQAIQRAHMCHFDHLKKRLQKSKDVKEIAHLTRQLQRQPAADNQAKAFMQLMYKKTKERCTTLEQNEEMVKEYLMDLVGERFVGTDLNYVKSALAKIDRQPIDDIKLGRLPEFEEVRTVIKEAKAGKANLGMTTDVLQELLDFDDSDCFITAIHEMLCDHINGDKVIDEMNDVRMTPLKKKLKASEAKHYRWICVCHVMQKIMDQIFIKRLMPFVQERLSVQQCGFMKGREALDATMMLNRIIGMRKAQNQHTWILFMDAIGAFPRMSREVMKLSLERFGLQENAMKWIDAMYNDTKVTASVNGNDVQLTAVAGGIQGAVATPLLYIISKHMCDQTFRKLHPEYNELMVETTKEAGFVSAKTAGAVRQTEQGVEQIAMDSVIYADDEAAIHGGTREELETMCTVIYRHQRAFGTQIHKDGTKSMILLVPGKNQKYSDFVEPDDKVLIKGDPEKGFFGFIKENTPANRKKKGARTTVKHVGQNYTSDFNFVADSNMRKNRAKALFNNGKEIWGTIDSDSDDDSNSDSDDPEEEEQQLQQKMKWYNQYIVPNLIQNTEVWPLKLTKVIVDFHDDCIRKICNYNTKKELEDNQYDNQESLRRQTNDIGMETHLRLRLLQWVGRAVQKNRLGIHALKGMVTQSSSSKAVKATATDERISHAIKHLATRLKESSRGRRIKLMWPQEDSTKMVQEIITTEQLACNLENGHAHEEISKDELKEKKCPICNKKIRYGIQNRKTAQVYSGLHKHFETCEGFAKKFDEKAEAIRKEAMQGHTSTINLHKNFQDRRAGPWYKPTMQIQSIKDREQLREAKQIQQEMQQTATWQDYAKHSNIWTRLLKTAY